MGLRLLGFYDSLHFFPNASLSIKVPMSNDPERVSFTHLLLSRCMTLDKSLNHGFSFFFYRTEIMILPYQLHGIIVLNEKIFGTVFWKLLHAFQILNRETQLLFSLLKGEWRLREWQRSGRNAGRLIILGTPRVKW